MLASELRVIPESKYFSRKLFFGSYVDSSGRIKLAAFTIHDSCKEDDKCGHGLGIQT